MAPLHVCAIDTIRACILVGLLFVTMDIGLINPAEDQHMSRNLAPDTILCQTHIAAMLSVKAANSFVALDGDGQFRLATLDANGELQLNDINFSPPFPIDGCGSDPAAGLIWAIRGRGLYVFDLDNRITRHRDFTIVGDEEIRQVLVCDRVRKLLLVSVFQLWDGMTRLSLYDLTADSLVSDTLAYVDSFIRIEDGRILCNGRDDPSAAFAVRLLNITEGKIRIDATSWLASRLTQRKALLNALLLPKEMENAGLFCQIETGVGQYALCSVRWSSREREVSLEPWTVQYANEFQIAPFFSVDQSGSWMRAPVFDAVDIRSDHSALFHLDNRYPQGVSAPVLAEGSRGESPGAFVQHEEWGGLYLEPDIQRDYVILVFRLQNAQRIAERITPSVKQ